MSRRKSAPRRDLSVCWDLVPYTAEKVERTQRYGLLITMPDSDTAPYVFADESGKFQDENFICLCAYLSSGKKWDEFQGKWEGLRSNLHLPAVHLSTFYRDCKRLGHDEAHSTRLLEQFLDIIKQTISIRFAVALDAMYYRGMPPAAKRGFGDPGVACLQRLLRLIRDRFRDISTRLSITIDEDEVYAIGFYKTISRLRRADKELGRIIGAITFADDTFALPLQAADIVGGLTRRWLRDRIAGTATADVLPPLLQRLQIVPWEGEGPESISELWDGEELRKHLDKFLSW